MMKKYFTGRIIFFLVILSIFALLLRLYQLPEGLIFGYDQARDVYRAMAIIRHGDLKLLGPETDIPGLHHGVGYYYLIGIPYALFNDPVSVTVFLGIVNVFGVFIMYLTSWYLFQDKTVALLSSVLYAVSFEIVQYARWLSNPSLAVVSSSFAFLFIYRWIRGESKGFFWAVFFISLSLHFQFFLVYLYLIPLIVYFLYRPKTDKQDILKGSFSAIIINIPFITAELKFNFQGTKALLNYLSSQSNVYSPVSDFFIRYLDRFGSVVFHTLLPLNPTLATVIVLSLVLLSIKRLVSKKPAISLTEKKGLGFLLIWLFSATFLFIFSSGALNSEFSFVGVVGSIIILAAYFIGLIWTKNRLLAYLVIAVLFLLNLRFNLTQATYGSYIFSVQREMTYGLEKN